MNERFVAVSTVTSCLIYRYSLQLRCLLEWSEGEMNDEYR